MKYVGKVCGTLPGEVNLKVTKSKEVTILSKERWSRWRQGRGQQINKSSDHCVGRTKDI